MAETIARDYLEKQGLADKVKVDVSSSGIGLREKKTYEEEVAQQLSAIRNAWEYGLYQEVWRQRQAERFLKGEIHDPDLRQILVDYVVKKEEMFRDQALQEIGLVAVGSFHRPTQVVNKSDEWRVILGMEPAHVEKVRELYGELRHPHIDVLNAYAGLPGEVPNPFCQQLPAYRNLRDHLLMAVPKTIERAVGAYGG